MSAMPASEVLDVLAVDHDAAPEGKREPEPGRKPSRFAPLLRSVIGWCWRWAVGGLLCFNYLGSILVVGWTYRWMRAVVLRGWWKQSRFRERGSFEDFCAALGRDAPVNRPRWFMRERLPASLRKPTASGTSPGRLTLVGRLLLAPCHSLWRNFTTGLQGLFCTFLLTGWGCLLMVFSWWFGWLNSFHKGYEEAWVGPTTGLLGVALFIAAMFYVPMAQVHQAATGSCWAFFDFRFVWRLIQARLTAYVGLAALILLVALPFEVLKTLPLFFEAIHPPLADVPDAALLKILQNYLLACCFALFPTLLLIRLLAAVIYRSAVLKVLRRGWVSRGELHPVLSGWLRRLDLDLGPAPTPGAWQQAVRFGGRLVYRRLLYGLLVLIWLLFAAKVYVGEFFNYHPSAGFLNHPLIQLPCFDYVPSDLRQTAKP